MSTAQDDATPTPLAYWQGLFMLPRAIWMPIIAMSVVAIGAFYFNEWSVKRLAADAARLTSLMAMQTDLVDLRARIADAETGQRGYLLTRDPRHLEPYEEALALLPVIGARLLAQASGEPGLLPHAQKLESLRAQEMSGLRATALLAQQGERDAVTVVVRTGEGRIVMDVFRDEARSLLLELERRVAELRDNTARNVQLSRIAFAALGMLLLLLLLVVVRLLLKDFWRQEAARQEQIHEQQRLEQLVDKRTIELSELTTYLQTVTEQEKAELARDLHDELGGLLTAAKMDLSWLQGRASGREPEARPRLDALANLIDEAMSLKRRVVENLRPALLDHFGLPTALQAYFEDTCKNAGLDCKAIIPENFEHVPQELAIALFRVGQESLTNIIRHAGARNVEMTFDMDERNYRMRITDDGVGIDPQKLSGALSHGLIGMRHRIDSLGGKFRICANEPRGTRVEVIVPRGRAG
jgi:signal transduction histidine kinase